MVVTSRWLIGLNNFQTATIPREGGKDFSTSLFSHMVFLWDHSIPIWSIVHSSPFQPIIVANIVCVFFLEFVIGKITESFSPKDKSFLNGKSNALIVV